MPKQKGFILTVRKCKECQISLPISEFKPIDGIPQLWVCRGCRAKNLKMRRMKKKGEKAIQEKVMIYQGQMREEESDVGVDDSHSQTSFKKEVVDVLPVVEEKIIIVSDPGQHCPIDQTDFLSKLKRKKKNFSN